MPGLSAACAHACARRCHRHFWDAGTQGRIRVGKGLWQGKDNQLPGPELFAHVLVFRVLSA